MRLLLPFLIFATAALPALIAYGCRVTVEGIVENYITHLNWLWCNGMIKDALAY